MDPSMHSNSNEPQPLHDYTARHRVARYTGPPVESLTADQERIRHEILASRPRTGGAGPFGPWLAVPGIADPAQRLGQACRYGTSLSVYESELVILLTGAKLRSPAEFDIHVPEARRAGLTMSLIQAIPRDDEFSLQAVKERLIPLLAVENDRNERNDTVPDSTRVRAIALFAAELLDTCTISDDTYAATKAACNGQDSVLVEITSVVGYYSFVAYTLNVFQIPST